MPDTRYPWYCWSAACGRCDTGDAGRHSGEWGDAAVSRKLQPCSITVWQRPTSCMQVGDWAPSPG